MYTSNATWTHLQNSAAATAAEAPTLRYPPKECLSNDHEGRPNQHESKSCVMKGSIPS